MISTAPTRAACALALVCFWVEPALASCPDDVAAILPGARVDERVSPAICQAIVSAARRIPQAHRGLLSGLTFDQVATLPISASSPLLERVLAEAVLAIYSYGRVTITAAGARGYGRWTHGDVPPKQLVPLLNSVRDALKMKALTGPDDPDLPRVWTEFARRIMVLRPGAGTPTAVGAAVVFDTLVHQGAAKLLGAATLEDVLLHELGHAIHSKAPGHLLVRWARLSDWGVTNWNLAPEIRFTRAEDMVVHLRHLLGGDRGTTRYRPSPDAGFPSDYARFVPMEDFAEAYRWAITDPARLADAAPAKFLAMNALGWVSGATRAPLLHAALTGAAWEARLLRGTQRLLGHAGLPVGADDAAAILTANASLLATVCPKLGAKDGQSTPFDVRVGDCVLRPTRAQVDITSARLLRDAEVPNLAESFVTLAEQALDDLIAGRSGEWKYTKRADRAAEADTRAIDALAALRTTPRSGMRKALDTEVATVLNPAMHAENPFPGRIRYAVDLRARYPKQTALAIMLRSDEIVSHDSRVSALVRLGEFALGLDAPDVVRKIAKAIGDNPAILRLVGAAASTSRGRNMVEEIARGVVYPPIRVRALVRAARPFHPQLIADAEDALLQVEHDFNARRDHAALATFGFLMRRLHPDRPEQQHLKAVLAGSKDDPGVAADRLWAVTALLDLKRAAEANELLDAAIAHAEKTPNMPVYAHRFAAIAAAARQLGRHEEAVRQLKRIRASLRGAKSAYRIHRVITETWDRLRWHDHL